MRRITVIIGVIKNKNQYLLTKRIHRSKKLNGLWQFPGGTLESKENIYQCLEREIEEETNLSIEKAKLIPIIIEKKYKKTRLTVIPFLCTVNFLNQTININNEASDYQWFSKENINKLRTMDGTKEILNCSQENGKYLLV